MSTTFRSKRLDCIVGDKLISPYQLPERLKGSIYRIFLERVLPDLMGNVPATTSRNIWFQHNEVSAHFSYTVQECFDRTYQNKIQRTS